MQLISTNIGHERELLHAKDIGKTGIFKQPTEQPVQISATGLAGDAICDVENHGGVDQAVYVYGWPDYVWWSTELGRPLEPGTFGENITIDGLESAQLQIGDRLHIGEVVLEVTAPRIPCVTLAQRMEDPTFVKRFRAAERPGLYCRVIQPGTIRPNDPVSYEPYSGPTITALEMFRDAFEARPSEESILRMLAAPIAIRARHHKQAQLEAIRAK